MARSVKKGPYVVESLVKKIETMNRSGDKRVLKTWVKEHNRAVWVAHQEDRQDREGRAVLLAEQAIGLLEEAGLGVTAGPLRARLVALQAERQAARADTPIPN